MPEKNPYPAGSYRAKAWDRAQREKAEKEGKQPEKESPPDEVEEEKRRREELGYLRRKRDAQSTDRNN